MGLAQVRGIDRAQRIGDGRAQFAAIDQVCRARQDLVLARDVARAEHRAREHEFPVHAGALVLDEFEVERRAQPDDKSDASFRRDHVGDLLPVRFGAGEAGNRVDVAKTRCLELRPQRLAMIDDVVGAHALAPGHGFFTRSGRDHLESGAARELDCDRTQAAGAGDDQQRPAAIAAVGIETETIEQQLPGSERRQWQRRRFGEIQRLRLGSDDAFVDKLQLGVAARPGDIAGVVHGVARLEQGHRIADCNDAAGGIPAEDLRLRFDL